MIFSATVVKGTLKPDDPPRWAGYLTRHEGKSLTVEIKPPSTRRTLSQNSFYWSQIVPTVAHFLSEATGQFIDSDQAHYVLKCTFIGKDETPLGPVPRSSRALSVEEFSTYVDRISAYCASEWALDLGPREDQ
jgi:hypothetical protein